MNTNEEMKNSMNEILKLSLIYSLRYNTMILTIIWLIMSTIVLSYRTEYSYSWNVVSYVRIRVLTGLFFYCNYWKYRYTAPCEKPLNFLRSVTMTRMYDWLVFHLSVYVDSRYNSEYTINPSITRDFIFRRIRRN